MMIRRSMLLAFLAISPAPAAAADLKFERIVIDADFPDGYQVEVADVDGDGKPDLVGVGGGTCAWYRNPTWQKRIISTPRDTPDIISSATRDLDGDGRAEVAIAYDFAMNEPKRGKLLLAIQGAGLDDPWTFQAVAIEPPAFVGGGGLGGPGISLARSPAPIQGNPSFPSIHRVRWGQISSARPVPGVAKPGFKPVLIAASIFGQSATPPKFDQETAKLLILYPGDKPKSGQWEASTIARYPVFHAIAVGELHDQSNFPEILTASNDGVKLVHIVVNVSGVGSYENQLLVPGTPGSPPKQGASEVHLGRLEGGQRLLATVEPWHGTDVAVYRSESLNPLRFGPRTVIDDTLDDGHALWLADVDGDGTDEVFAGHRGKDARVSVYRLEGDRWARTVIDRGITAQDLRGGDLDGDGVPDVVAIGGRSHNVVWYRPIRDGAGPAAKSK